MKRRFSRPLFGFALLGVVAISTSALAAVKGSKHDLSTVGSDPQSNQICVFCHTPHSANELPLNGFSPNGAPLWNRFVDTSKTYTLYSSPTLHGTPGQPSGGISILCLGCHDGSIGTAVVAGVTGSDKHDLVLGPDGSSPDTSSSPNCAQCHPDVYGAGPAVQWIGTDLSNDHPINIGFPGGAAAAEFNVPPDPSAGWTDVKLYNGKVECPTCHDPHNGTGLAMFLRKDNNQSALCLTCHNK